MPPEGGWRALKNFHEFNLKKFPSRRHRLHGAGRDFFCLAKPAGRVAGCALMALCYRG
jgi:hypothetical protein